MKWEGNRQSDNVEDRREDAPTAGKGFRSGGKRLGVGSIAVALLLGWLLDINPLTVLGLLEGSAVPTAAHQETAVRRPPPVDDRMVRFVSTVLADTEDVWKDTFQRNGGRYQEPRLVLFHGQTSTACGTGQSATGPFYCPGDHRVYIDLDFFQALENDLGAPGEFAQAYVVAHEVGHHVQNLLGITHKVDSLRSRISQTEYNALSVRLELQADCFAGLWANRSHASRQTLEKGDIEAAMNAAAKIGDDALQQRTQGRVVPDSFTHGSSAQRVRWFNNGLKSANLQSCDTFSVKNI